MCSYPVNRQLLEFRLVQRRCLTNTLFLFRSNLAIARASKHDPCNRINAQNYRKFTRALTSAFWYSILDKVECPTNNLFSP